MHRHLNLIIFLIGFALFGASRAPEESYRIEVVKDTIQKAQRVETIPKEIRFISPGGKVVKTIEKSWYKTSVREENGVWSTEVEHVENILENAVLLWKCEYKTPYDPRGRGKPSPVKHNYTVEVLNKKGETVLKKEFQVYPLGMPAIPYWSTGISKDGSTVYVYYRDSSDVFHVEVYDTTGKKLTETSYPHEFNADMQISPDGKIFGAKTFKKDVGKCLFFLDVETGRTKVVKAEGKGWRVWFSLLTQIPTSEGYKYLPSKYVNIWWKIHGEKGRKIISFDEIPDDLSTLFKKGGEK